MPAARHTLAGNRASAFIVGLHRLTYRCRHRWESIHPKWRHPMFSILVQTGISLACLLLSNITNTSGSYLNSWVAATILYFVRSFYVCGYGYATWPVAEDVGQNVHAVFIPGGKLGVWSPGRLGFLVDLCGALFWVVVRQAKTTHQSISSSARN